MIVLDEQIMRQRIAVAISRWYQGQVTNVLALRPNTIVKDDSIPTLLLQVQSPTFVTINAQDFWFKVPAHRRYCIVSLDLPQTEVLQVPSILRNLLQKPEFTTKENRMGKVIRVQGQQVRFYGLDRQITLLK